jgi:hypothetical protein
MTETKFTPGPWRWYESSEYGYASLESNDRVVLESGGMNEGDFPITWMGEEMTAADAALIATAPELYPMTAELLEIARRYESGDFIQRAEAILAKARGE